HEPSIACPFDTGKPCGNTTLEQFSPVDNRALWREGRPPLQPVTLHRRRDTTPQNAMDAACHKCTTSVRKILLERSGNTSGLTSENHTRRPCSREEPLSRAPVAARVLAVTTHRPHHVPHRRPSGRPLRALVALLGAALL